MAPQKEISPNGPVIAATLRRGIHTTPTLGFIIEGGSDSPLKYICIKSIDPNTPASECGQFRQGDQMVMFGDSCLIGVSCHEARMIMNKIITPNVEVIVQRKPGPAISKYRDVRLKRDKTGKLGITIVGRDDVRTNMKEIYVSTPFLQQQKQVHCMWQSQVEHDSTLIRFPVSL